MISRIIISYSLKKYMQDLGTTSMGELGKTENGFDDISWNHFCGGVKALWSGLCLFRI